jgi:hypothetical protein
MARSLLIALLAVAAVATPAAASGPASWVPLPAYEPVTVEQDGEGTVITVWMPSPDGLACSTDACATTAAVRSGPDAACRAAEVRTTNSWPGYYIEADPDDCLQDLIVFAFDQLPPVDGRLPDEWAVDATFQLLS